MLLGELASPPLPNAGDIPTSAFWESARPGVFISPTPAVRSGPDAWNSRIAIAVVADLRARAGPSSTYAPGIPRARRRKCASGEYEELANEREALAFGAAAIVRVGAVETFKILPTRKALVPGRRTSEASGMTCCSLRLAVGEDLAFVAAQLGHADTSVTHRYYLRVMRLEDGDRERLRALVDGKRDAPAPEGEPPLTRMPAASEG
jgi:hypothetical protein